MAATTARPDIDAFEPAQLGPLTLRNRVIKAATFEGRSPGPPSEERASAGPSADPGDHNRAPGGRPPPVR